jgi:hypothetical protein
MALARAISRFYVYVRLIVITFALDWFAAKVYYRSVQSSFSERTWFFLHERDVMIYYNISSSKKNLLLKADLS